MNVAIHRVTDVTMLTRHHKDCFSCVTISVSTSDGDTNEISLFLPFGQTLGTITTGTEEKEYE